MQEHERIKLLVTISRMYYEYNYSQQEISEKLDLSRTYIGKLLNEAKNKGIIEVRIIDPINAESELEEKLRCKYGLQKAILVPVDDSDPLLLESLGSAAAKYFDSVIKDSDVIGVSWGTTLHAFSTKVQQRSDLTGIQVVQLCGGVSKIHENVYVSEITRNIACAVNGTHHLIPLPAILDSVTAVNAVKKDKSIMQSLELARSASVAVFTVGVFGEYSAFVRANYFTPEEMMEIKEAGAVGDICSHIIDQNGSLCDPSMERRTVAVSYEDIKKISLKICIAANSIKHECILAALKAGCIDVLVTNEQTSEYLLQN